ncbi:hypothetical protein EXIGLDRAFT_721560 [Exidia glandulosa HHB12029]|uniref:Uncharacterized protein n=1 Tax=Exidia glandulosa HHB12029 TaxID=1314781 RepID=A0A165FMJ7_EXIGL|nr:hypothetical protein EXIGLDRAFT_721560 [Exidia glandulosa HHB12029]
MTSRYRARPTSRSPPDVPAIWESEVLPIVKPFWPMPIDDTLPPPGKIDHKAYMTVYTTVFDVTTTSYRAPPPALGPTSLISFHFDALVVEWTRAVCLYIGTDIQRYLVAWRSFQGSVKHTARLFAYMDRSSLVPLKGKGKSFEETSRLPLETEVCSSATALRRWRTEVVLPLFGKGGSIALESALPADVGERAAIAEELKASFLACGVTEDDDIVQALK